MSSSWSRRRARSSRGVLTGAGCGFAVFGRRAAAFNLVLAVTALAAGRAFVRAAIFFSAGFFSAGFFGADFFAAGLLVAGCRAAPFFPVDFFPPVRGLIRKRTAGRPLVFRAETFDD